MFDMFKGMGAMASLMSKLPKIREQAEALQKRMGELVVEGDAGAGMVKVKCNGRMEVVGITVSEEAMKDRELLEDLLRAAVNQSLLKAKQVVAEETHKMTSELGLPTGMQLPGT